MAESPSRRLAAVWFADIVGYTTLSERDEEAALLLVKELQALSNREVGAHAGRVVKFVGDAVLAVFESAGDAVEGALALMGAFNGAELAKEAKVTLRIGVHVGEIHTADDGDVYGDGVNTASRIQGAALPGQVFLSSFALESVRHRSSLRTESVGKHRLKGLSRSMELFVVGPVAGGDPRVLRFSPPVAVPAREPLRKGQVIGIGLLAGMAGLVGLGVFAGVGGFDFGDDSGELSMKPALPMAPMTEVAEVALNLGKESFFQQEYERAIEDLTRSLELTENPLQRRQALRYLARTHHLLRDSAASLRDLGQLLATEPPLAILHPSLEEQELMELYMEARAGKIRTVGVEMISEPLRKIMVFDFHVFAPEMEMGSQGMTGDLGYVAALMIQTELEMKGLPVASVEEMSFQEGSYDAYLDLDSALLEMRDEGPSHLLVGSVSIGPRGALLSAWLYEMGTGSLVLSAQVTGTQEDLAMKLPETLADRLVEAVSASPGGE